MLHVCVCVLKDIVGLKLQSHLSLRCQPIVHAHIQPNHHHKILGGETQTVCPVSANRGGCVCV